MKQERILGIDPGFGRVGYGVIEQKNNRDWQALCYGCIETDAKETFVERLKDVHEELIDLIKEFHPTRMARG